jgi:hypothetical protein
MPTPTTTTPIPASDKPPRRRRWIPLSLKLFIAMLIITGVVGLSWTGLHYRRQQLIKKSVEKLGGTVRTDNRTSYRLQQLLGPELSAIFDVVVAIDLNFTPTTDKDLQDLIALSGLEQAGSLSLDGTQITDQGLSGLSGMSQIHTLSICETRVTDAGLMHINNLPGLSNLRLYCTEISNAGLVHLSRLSNLQFLGLRATTVSDAGLVHLHGFKKLKMLFVESSKVSEAGVAELKQHCPALESVNRIESPYIGRKP